MELTAGRDPVGSPGASARGVRPSHGDELTSLREIRNQHPRCLQVGGHPGRRVPSGRARGAGGAVQVKYTDRGPLRGP
jgi:hypothetical protein